MPSLVVIGLQIKENAYIITKYPSLNRVKYKTEGGVEDFGRGINKYTGCPKKIRKFKIICLCSENRQVTKLCALC